MQMELLDENQSKVSVQKFVFNVPYREFTSLFFLSALAYTAFYLSHYNTVTYPHVIKPSCNLFEGQWVYDEKRYPLYKGKECSYLLEEFACEKYGRRNLTYLNWRWQPRNCDLPRFNGKAFMEKIRGKNLYFVGDSLNRNQWSSLLCLIESSLSPSSRKQSIRDEHALYFEATEYNATIGFYWSPFLVESNNDHLVFHYNKHRIVRINGIENNARHWTDADIIVFNSYYWWKSKEMSLLWGSFESPDAIYKRVHTRLLSYEMSLNTWADWLEFNINRTKTKMFFMSLSPTHYWGESSTWKGMNYYCYNETDPILKEGYVGHDTDIEMMHVLESTLQQLAYRGVKVQYLNITQLSDYRKDAHASIHKMFFYNVSKEQYARNPGSLADCLHWCLPGLPDTWNDILYAYIMDS